MKTVTITRQQAREIDRQAVEVYGMTSVMLMENAGRGLADRLAALGIAGPVVVCAGGGNNGGDGFVAARHLDLRGFAVRMVLLADPSGLRGDAALNFHVLERSGVPIVRPVVDALPGELAGCAWIVDALLGTGARGDPRPPFDRAIEAINASGVPTLAVDLPSGLDCDTGQAAFHTIQARHTCTFVAPKSGFLAAGAQQYTGTVHVCDIGAPRRLVEEILGGPAC